MGGADELRITQLGCIMPARTSTPKNLRTHPSVNPQIKIQMPPLVVFCVAASALQIPCKRLAKLLHLRPHDKRAVARIGVVRKVVLVVGLGRAVVL